MLTKKAVSQEELESGKIAYLTKNYCTYQVKYVGADGSRLVVEIVSCMMVHNKALSRAGLSKTWIHNDGSQVRVLPVRLFFVEEVEEVENKKESIWVRLLTLLRLKDVQNNTNSNRQ